MKTSQITVDDLRTGDMIFAENDDATTGAIHGRVLKMGLDNQGADVTWIEPVSHEHRRVSIKVRTGLFGAITRIDG